MLLFPKHFDENEWFIIIAALLSPLIWKLPKRIPTEITVIIILLGMAIPKVIDNAIASISPYDLYRLTDTEKYEIFDVILDMVYLPFGYLCVYFYDKLHPKGIKIVLYILTWAIFSVGFEFIAVKFHVFNYHGWKLIYSFPTYIVVISGILCFYRFLLSYYKKNPSKLNGSTQ
ncbi:hypothetical protein ABES02_26650 [Neobacillus pocheonensis]|uniref:hypothetical protein n=1 Tax=Neobacillus pocheonensis TaxID=363869 RepID=UPI003D2AD8E4